MTLSSHTVVHWSPDHDAIAAFEKREAGADLGVLERLAEVVLSGGPIHPTLQRIANAIIAEAILKGALPSKKAGRKNADAFKGHEAAYMFLELRDRGMGRTEAVAAVIEKFHVVERQIDRWVEEYRPMIGRFAEDRERFRVWREICEETGYQDYEATVRMDLNLREGASAVDVRPTQEQLVVEAHRMLEGLRSEKFTDIKSAAIDVLDSAPG
jgi:hypothetical protein